MDGSSRSCESFETKLGKSCVFQTCVTNAIILRVQKETSSTAVKYKHGKNKLAPLLKKQVLLLVSEDPEKKRRCHRFSAVGPHRFPVRAGRVECTTNVTSVSLTGSFAAPLSDTLLLPAASLTQRRWLEKLITAVTSTRQSSLTRSQ